MLYSANGDKYDGFWKDGKKDGNGVFNNANGDKYDGFWKDDNKDGKGVFYASGARYNEEWK